MNAYIAYSIRQEEKYIISLLAASLSDKGIFTTSRENDLLEKSQESLIEDTQAFIGIIVDKTYSQKVIQEYNYAKQKDIPSILFIDDNTVEAEDNAPYAIRFSRTQPAKAYDYLFTYRNTKAHGESLQTNLAFFIGGVVLESLMQIVVSSNIKSLRPKLNSVHIVEARLMQLGPSRFQELCDVFLAERFTELKHFARIGSKLGTQKTTVGTPDTIIELPNGKYVMVEITTQQSGVAEKIISDIDKVANEQKTGVPISKVWKIIICSNSIIGLEDKTEIHEHAKQAKIPYLEIFDLGTLAAQLYLNHKHLAQDYLELAADSGQIVSLDKFIKIYDSSGHSIATTLSNPFYHRTKELQELTQAIELNKLVLISGPAGVGKTKLAIEAIRFFAEQNPSYRVYSILNKDVDILEDLYSNFIRGSQNVLFIDDVNRFGRVNSVLGFFRSAMDIDLKIVLTTRDYGLSYIQTILADVQYYHLQVDKFKDEEILDIIKASPFSIANNQYSNKILNIANGNARLAIMAAKLAIDKQDIRVLNDVSDLLDSYFTTFSKDEEIFNDKTLLKCIGIISFFYTFPYANTKVIEETAINFNLSKTVLVDSIDKLEELEFLDLNFDHAKIADQTLATFYFYKVFIKNKLYSFYDLLKLYFSNNQEKFKDSFYPLVNSFGFQQVKDLTLSDLNKYFKELLSESDEQALSFLKVFYFFLHEECLHFVFVKTQSLSVEGLSFDIDYQSRRDDHTTKDTYLDLLDNFYQTDILLKETLEVSFEYVKRRPHTLKELLKNIVQELTFDLDDHHYGYNRQRILLDLFENKIHARDEIYLHSFLAIAHEFLEFNYRKSKAGRGLSINLYSFPFQLTDESRQIRQRIWELVYSLYSQYSDKVLSILQKHSSIKPDVEKTVMEFDLQFIVPFIEKNLSPDNFHHSLYVQELLHWIKRKEIILKDSDHLKNKFQNKYYQWYQKLRWDRFKGKDEFEFKDWKEFQNIKEADIRNFTFYKNENDFFEFIEFFNTIKETVKSENYQTNNSLDIILEESVKKDPAVGFNYFRLAIQHLKKQDLSFVRTISSIASTNPLQELFWKLHLDQTVSDYLTLTFLSHLPLSDLKDMYLSGLYEILRNSILDIYFIPDHFQNFATIDPGFYESIGKISIEKNNSKTAKITIDDRYFRYFANKVSDKEILQKVYLQQEKLQNHFDYSGEGLFNILAADPGFLMEYVKFIGNDCINHSHYADKQAFSMIWDLPNYEVLLDNVLNLMIDPKFLSVGESFANAFFKHVSQDKKPLRDEYILNFIKQNYASSEKMDLIFDVIHHSAGDIFNKAFISYLKLNSNVQDFAKINWIDTEMVFHGEVIIGDIKAAKWRNILQLVEEANLGLNGFFIVKYIKDQIEAENRYANWERERKFLSRR